MTDCPLTLKEKEGDIFNAVGAALVFSFSCLFSLKNFLFLRFYVKQGVFSISVSILQDIPLNVKYLFPKIV